MLKKNRSELVERFRELAPTCAPVSIQTWSYRRLSLTAGVLLCAFIAFVLVTSNLRGAGLISPPEATTASLALVVREPQCDHLYGLDPLGLMAQSVPTASFIPCTTRASEGWEFSGMDVRNGRTKMFFHAAPVMEAPGDHELVVVLQETCPVEGLEVPSGLPGLTKLDATIPGRDSVTGPHRFLFEGGCVEYRFDLEGDDWPNFVGSSSLALDFRSRVGLNNEIQRLLGWEEHEKL